MSGPQFHETRMGARFYERDVPELIRQVARLADATERILAAMEARGEALQDTDDRDAGEVRP